MNDILLLSMPVVHRGYLDFFDRVRPNVRTIGVLDTDLINELSLYKPDIAAIDPMRVVDLLKLLGYTETILFTKSELVGMTGKDVVLVDDQISRSLAEQHLRNSTVHWESVFLRWDREKIFTEKDEGAVSDSSSESIALMKEAFQEAKKSSDWWRQVGAVVARDGEVILRGYNEGVPDDHEPYKTGAIRDFLQPGERPDFASTIHAEQSIIAEAVREGISLRGTRLFVTHFPCMVCAKILSRSGVEACYYSEGSSNLDGKKVLQSAGVDIFLVNPESLL